MAANLAFCLSFSSFIALFVLLVWTAASGLIGGGDANGNNQGQGQVNNGWFGFGDMTREEAAAFKTMLSLLILTVACGTLWGPISKAGTGYFERFNEGVLAAALFMFGNMLAVSFWYNLSFDRREEGNNNNRYYGGGNYYWAMDERERLQYHQRVVSYVTLALAALFYAVAACAYGGAKMIPEEARQNAYAQVHTHIRVQQKKLSDLWKLLSLCTFVVFASLFVAACVMTGGEEADRMMEEGRLVNLILVLLWVVGAVGVMLSWGSEVFIPTSTGSLGVGLLYGGAKYFAGLLVLVCVLTSNPIFDRRGREEGVWVVMATAFASFFLAVFHALFAGRLRDYQVLVIDAGADVTVLEPKSEVGMVHSATGPFVRVEQP